MASKSFAAQRAQIGKETVPGTAVAATALLAGGTLTINRKPEMDSIVPGGEDFATLTYLKKETTEAKLEGVPTYNEIGDHLRLAFGTPTTTVVEAGFAWSHAYQLAAGRKTITIEYGDATSAVKVAGVFADSFEASWGMNSGDHKLALGLIAGPVTTGVTLTAGCTRVTPHPIVASQVKVYCDASEGMLGDTEVAVLSVGVKFDKIAELLLTSAGSDSVRRAPDAALEILAVVGTLSDALYADMHSSTTKYWRIEATGGLISGASTAVEKLTFDFAAQGADHDGGGEKDGAYAATVKLHITKDAAGFSHLVTLVNGIA